MKHFSTFIIGLFISIAPLSGHTAEPTIDQKVLNTFHQLFPRAEQVHWRSTASFCEATFNSGVIKIRVLINPDGQWVRTIRYYKEDLPSNILLNVRNKYKKEEIYGVTEIMDPQGTNYYIILHNEKHIYEVVATASGSITQIRKFKRDQ